MFASTLSLVALIGVTALMFSRFAAAAGPAPADKEVVVIDTTMGVITVELDRGKAPISVENFLKYVDKGFYDGMIFHRVIPGFMVQTGGMKEVGGKLEENRKDAFDAIKNESGNGLSNARGTLAMARTSNPNSATSQFFINHKDNANLDSYGGGYAVFGKVIDGLDVVDAIAKTATTTKSDAKTVSEHENVPVKAVSIKTVKRKS